MAMSLSLAVSAGAAFNDQDKIVNEEAVDMCVALNIINGFEDNTFRPTDNVTRGQAAKMITIALNGGKEPTLSASANPTYTDIAGHWAAKYIEYCTSLGIVAGDGAGKFNPNGNVKAVELAKMLLIAIGYEADAEKFVGKNWDTNVNVIASQKDLYEDLESIDPAAAATRDTAAQMVWNALNAKMVDYDYKLSTDANGNLVSALKVYDLKATLLGEKYGVVDTEAAVMTGFTYVEDDAEWIYTFSQDGNLSYTTIKSDVDYTDLFQQNVKVIYTEKVAGGIDTVYGMFAYESSVIAEGVFGDIDWTNYAADLADGIVTISDVEYDITGTSLNKAEFNGAVADLKSVSDAAKGYSIKAIDNTGDEKVDIIVYVPFSVEKVTYVGASTITTAKTGNVKVENINLADTVAKDDYVMIVKDTNTVDGVAEYTKLDVLSGKVAATKGGDVQVDGTWYTPVAKMELDKEYDFVAVNGYVYVANETSTTVAADDYAVVVKYQKAADWDAEYAKATLLMTSGETSTVLFKTADKGTAISAEGDLVKIVDVEDDVYALTKVDAVEIDDTKIVDADADAYSKETGKIGTTAISDDAIIFVKDTSDTPVEYKVISGADLKKLDDIAADSVSSAASLKNESTGYSAVVFAYVTTSMTTSEDVAYGYVISDATASVVDSKTVYTFTIWNGTAEVELTTDGTNVKAAPDKGATIEYKVTDGKVSSLKPAGTPAAVVGYDGYNINFEKVDVDYVIGEDTVVIYIDAADKAYAEGGEIALAHDNDDTDKTDYVKNVAYVAGTDKDDDGKLILDVLVVDIDGHIDGTTVLK